MFYAKVPFVLFFLSVIGIVKSSSNDTVCPNVRNEFGLMRKRRHVAFPDGSNVVLTISLVKAFMTHAPAGWNIALEIDVPFPLPDSKFTLAQFRKKLHHRQKREIWDTFKNILELHNINGRSCILRSICDAKMFLLPPGISLIHDILRAILTAPLHDEEFLEEIKINYNELLDPDLCAKVEDCPVSLLSFITELNLVAQE